MAEDSPCAGREHLLSVHPVAQSSATGTLPQSKYGVVFYEKALQKFLVWDCEPMLPVTEHLRLPFSGHIRPQMAVNYTDTVRVWARPHGAVSNLHAVPEKDCLCAAEVPVPP